MTQVHVIPVVIISGANGAKAAREAQELIAETFEQPGSWGWWAHAAQVQVREPILLEAEE